MNTAKRKRYYNRRHILETIKTNTPRASEHAQFGVTTAVTTTVTSHVDQRGTAGFRPGPRFDVLQIIHDSCKKTQAKPLCSGLLQFLQTAALMYVVYEYITHHAVCGQTVLVKGVVTVEHSDVAHVPPV